MKRYIVYLAWAWEILIGGLLITPRGTFCIACGTIVQAPGYIGRPATLVIGVLAIALGAVGIATAGIGKTSVAGGG
ncbi:MAG: hypothetical protein ACHQ03_10950 [Candidatus Bathyarchaeia archaeon]